MVSYTDSPVFCLDSGFCPENFCHDSTYFCLNHMHFRLLTSCCMAHEPLTLLFVEDCSKKCACSNMTYLPFISPHVPAFLSVPLEPGTLVDLTQALSEGRQRSTQLIFKLPRTQTYSYRHDDHILVSQTKALPDDKPGLQKYSRCF